MGSPALLLAAAGIALLAIQGAQVRRGTPHFEHVQRDDAL